MAAGNTAALPPIIQAYIQELSYYNPQIADDERRRYLLRVWQIDRAVERVRRRQSELSRDQLRDLYLWNMIVDTVGARESRMRWARRHL